MDAERLKNKEVENRKKIWKQRREIVRVAEYGLCEFNREIKAG